MSDRQHLYCRQSQSHWSVGINNEIVETITSSQQQVRKNMKNHPFQLELHDHIMRSATENRKDRFLYKSQSIQKRGQKHRCQLHNYITVTLLSISYYWLKHFCILFTSIIMYMHVCANQFRFFSSYINFWIFLVRKKCQIDS